MSLTAHINRLTTSEPRYGRTLALTRKVAAHLYPMAAIFFFLTIAIVLTMGLRLAIWSVAFRH